MLAVGRLEGRSLCCRKSGILGFGEEEKYQDQNYAGDDGRELSLVSTDRRSREILPKSTSANPLQK